MKKVRMITALAATGIAALLFTASSCKKEEDTDMRSKTYTMSTYNSSGVTGTVTFMENSDNTTTVRVSMMGTTAGAQYPAHIHENDITMAGSVIHELGPVPASGNTATKDTKINMTYDQMIAFDGCFVAHNPNDISDYVLVGNIGSNAP